MSKEHAKNTIQSDRKYRTKPSREDDDSGTAPRADGDVHERFDDCSWEAKSTQPQVLILLEKQETLSFKLQEVLEEMADEPSLAESEES